MKLVSKNYGFLDYMYYTHPGYETSIFGKNCAHYIQIFTVITEIQNGCHLATFCRINPKIELVLPITVVHDPTRFYENHFETSCIILFRHWQLHDWLVEVITMMTTMTENAIHILIQTE